MAAFSLLALGFSARVILAPTRVSSATATTTECVHPNEEGQEQNPIPVALQKFDHRAFLL